MTGIDRQRDDLVLVIRPLVGGVSHARRIADAVLAAGYRRLSDVLPPTASARDTEEQQP